MNKIGKPNLEIFSETLLAEAKKIKILLLLQVTQEVRVN